MVGQGVARALISQFVSYTPSSSATAEDSVLATLVTWETHVVQLYVYKVLYFYDNAMLTL